MSLAEASVLLGGAPSASAVELECGGTDEESSISSGELPQAVRRLSLRLSLAILALGGVAVLLFTVVLGTKPATRAEVLFVGGAVPVLGADALFDQNQGLAPYEHLHDGNLCEDDEELSGGLCYKTCKELTDGQYPARGSPFSCCTEHPCSFNNQKIELEPCHGFDVGGNNAGGGCPHLPGACLTDEELHLGRCYKKCSLLTENIYPYRIAAETCCKVKGIACLDLFLTKTNLGYGIGGGDGSNKDSPSGAHFPLSHLTEVVTVSR